MHWLCAYIARTMGAEEVSGGCRHVYTNCVCHNAPVVSQCESTFPGIASDCASLAHVSQTPRRWYRCAEQSAVMRRPGHRSAKFLGATGQRCNLCARATVEHDQNINSPLVTHSISLAHFSFARPFAVRVCQCIRTAKYFMEAQRVRVGAQLFGRTGVN